MNAHDVLRGELLVIDGCDMCGKTTTINNLAKLIEVPVLIVRCPGTTPLGDQVRNTLIAGKLHPRFAVGSFVSAIVDTQINVINPALEEGYFVICDRYFASTFAYNLTDDTPDEFMEYALAMSPQLPDFNVQLKLDEATYLKRQQAVLTGNREEVMDNDRLGFEAVSIIQSRIEQWNKALPDGVNFTVNADQPQDDVVREVLSGILTAGGNDGKI